MKRNNSEQRKNRTKTQNDEQRAQCKIINVINLEMLETTCRNTKDGKNIIEEEALPFRVQRLR
uniref:Uncharacterized protein n=1 Tax=Solanum tuberosum TaxID=4113 RepID=M1BQP1_SOLTU